MFTILSFDRAWTSNAISPAMGSFWNFSSSLLNYLQLPLRFLSHTCRFKCQSVLWGELQIYRHIHCLKLWPLDHLSVRLLVLAWFLFLVKCVSNAATSGKTHIHVSFTSMCPVSKDKFALVILIMENIFLFFLLYLYEMMDGNWNL